MSERLWSLDNGVRDFSVCPRYLLCTYNAPQCGGVISGLADGTYTFSAFIDSGGDADPGDPVPASGDGLPSDWDGVPEITCPTDTITGGAMVGPVNIVVRYVMP